MSWNNSAKNSRQQTQTAPAHSSATIREQVEAAMALQWQRQGKYNSQLTVAELDAMPHVHEEAKQLLAQVMKKLNLSARIYHRLIKVARTIADFEAVAAIEKQHIAEALQYRVLDKIKTIY